MSEHKEKFDWAYVFTAFIIAVPLLFAAGHFSAVVSDENFSFGQLTEMTVRHLKSHPFDVLHFNISVFAVMGFVLILILIMGFFRPNVPKAEMKGMEHGSNDFESRAELEKFLRENTTEIFELESYDQKDGGKNEIMPL